MTTARVSEQITVNFALRGTLSHADTKKLILNQPNKGTQRYNHHGQQHQTCQFLWRHDPTKPI